MTDCFKPKERSRIMARIHSNGNNTTELRFVKMLREQKIFGWRRRIALPGRPDFVFRKQKVAIFVDGDFWHGNPRGFRLPKSNRGYWRKKIDGNRKRDLAVNRLLKKLGWRVVRFWESSLKNEKLATARLQRALAKDSRVWRPPVSQ